jgi:phosphohistidine phosphatase
MKTLLLLRHAKSSWADDRLSDFDRPLNDRGRRDAPRMGGRLRQDDLVPDLIIASPAKRAATTARLVAEAASYEGEIRHAAELYMADPQTYLDVARGAEDNVSILMLVGHNPGIEECVTSLAGHDETMPTAALACFRLPIDRWPELQDEGPYELANLWRPKEL